MKREATRTLLSGACRDTPSRVPHGATGLAHARALALRRTRANEMRLADVCKPRFQGREPDSGMVIGELTTESRPPMGRALHRARPALADITDAPQALLEHAARGAPTSDAPSPPDSVSDFSPRAAPGDRDRFRRYSGERATTSAIQSVFPLPRSPEGPFRTPQRRAFAAPPSRLYFALCGFPRRATPRSPRPATTRQSFDGWSRSLIPTTIPKYGHNCARRLLARRGCFSRRSVRRRSRADCERHGPGPYEPGMDTRKGVLPHRPMAFDPACALRRRGRLECHLDIRLSPAVVVTTWKVRGHSATDRGPPLDRPRERIRPSCEPGCLR
jgi:hypothetical protein